MSDWDFLYDMHDEGYTAEQISDAQASGYNPFQYANIYLDREWIDAELHALTAELPRGNFKSRDGFPFSTLEQSKIFYDLIECARRHFENTGRYLQIWGELGEIYAEINFNLRRHGTHAPGSDGTIAGKRVEVKTISPEKSNDRIIVKSQGDFEQLLIVYIDEDFGFKGKLFERNELKGTGKILRGQFRDF